MSAAIGGGSRRLSCRTLASCASMRKSNASCPARDARRIAQHGAERRAAAECLVRPDERARRRETRRTRRRCRETRGG